MTLFLRDQENRQQGIQQGRNEERRAMVLQMNNEGLPLDMIARVARESTSVIKSWISEATNT